MLGLIRSEDISELRETLDNMKMLAERGESLPEHALASITAVQIAKNAWYRLRLSALAC